MKGKFWWTLGAGVLLGSYGVDLLSSKTARKAYNYIVAGGMIARDRLMADSEKVQAAMSDIVADAKEITERFYEKQDLECEDAELIDG